MWDVFISHASEDKEELVKPLANVLRNFGVDVWYDEFELKLGDSLSKSIDKGLIDSKFGIVVLSPNFFAKGWTDYEFRSLIGKEIGKEKTILPVWHDIARDEIANHSLFLADKFAVSSDIGINGLAQKIVEIVRPDIINSFALKALAEAIRSESSEIKAVPFKDLIEIDGVRHEILPTYMVVSVKLICDMLADIGLADYTRFLIDFAKDIDYDSEYIIWNAIACSYISYIQFRKIDFSDIEIKKTIFQFLLSLSLGTDKDVTNLNGEDRSMLTRLYQDNMVVFSKIFNT